MEITGGNDMVINRFISENEKDRSEKLNKLLVEYINKKEKSK